ncbi:hypothetical protein D9M69_547280 [compost metagenome]
MARFGVRAGRHRGAAGGGARLRVCARNRWPRAHAQCTFSGGGRIPGRGGGVQGAVLRAGGLAFFARRWRGRAPERAARRAGRRVRPARFGRRAGGAVAGAGRGLAPGPRERAGPARGRRARSPAPGPVHALPAAGGAAFSGALAAGALRLAPGAVHPAAQPPGARGQWAQRAGTGARAPHARGLSAAGLHRRARGQPGAGAGL